MKIDPVRLKKQQEGVAKWFATGKKGTFRWCTASGKTYLAVLAIKAMMKDNPLLTTIVAVPTDVLRTQWRDITASHGLNNIYVQTVHTLVKSKHECDLFILDEIHSYTGGPIFSTLFDCVNRSATLGLTAQERDNPDDKEVLRKNAPIIDVLTIADALNNGWISPFRVYNLGVQLTPYDKQVYQALNDEFNKYFSTFDFNFDLAMNCLRNKWARENLSKSMNMPIEVIDSHTFQFNRVMRRRKAFLYHSDAIFDAAVNVITTFKDKKIITFSESTDMADRITSKISDSRSFHSNISTQIINGKKYGKKRLLPMIMNDFKEGRVRVINSAKSLNEGVDIPDVDMSIKTSYTSKVLDNIQRLGRTLRKHGNKQATEINLYIPGSQSERWLKRSQRSTPGVSWIESVDQIDA